MKKIKNQTLKTTLKINIKSHPIFLDGVENIASLKQVLDEVAKDQYVIRILRDNQVKIQLLINNLTYIYSVYTFMYTVYASLLHHISNEYEMYMQILRR